MFSTCFLGGGGLLQEVTLGAVHLLPTSVDLDPLAPGSWFTSSVSGEIGSFGSKRLRNGLEWPTIISKYIIPREPFVLLFSGTNKKGIRVRKI